jgi:tetratricopeptide (TPR) repeat protein
MRNVTMTVRDMLNGVNQAANTVIDADVSIRTALVILTSGNAAISKASTLLSGALEDYNLSIQLERISVERATIFYNRGLLKQRLNDREGAIQDLSQAAKLYKEQGKTEDYQDALNQLQKMNATL